MTVVGRVWLWHEVAQLLAAQPAGAVLRVQKHQVEHPSAAGLVASMGLPVGQRSDFRWPQGIPVGLHVRDFGAHYEACLERTDAARRLVEQLGTATRGNHVAAMAALGALAGTLLGKKPEAVLAGAAVGGLLALLTVNQAAPDRGIGDVKS